MVLLGRKYEQRLRDAAGELHGGHEPDLARPQPRPSELEPGPDYVRALERNGLGVGPGQHKVGGGGAAGNLAAEEAAVIQADGGIDLVLRGHGATVLVQCKQWRVLQVGVDKVREIYGVMTAEAANRAILVTSGTFTKDAWSFKVGKPLTLVDGPTLATLVSEVRTHSPQLSQPTVKPRNRPTDAPPACPKCNAPMVLRTARRGANAGNSFYGCTRYPECKGIRDA